MMMRKIYVLKKIVILSIILLVSQVYASVDLESFEFNDSAGASFNTFINNGAVDSS